MGKLGKQLWKAVETDQGRSFVSDDFGSLPDEFVMEFCKNQLPSARRVVRAFEKISEVLKQWADVEERAVELDINDIEYRAMAPTRVLKFKARVKMRGRPLHPRAAHEPI